MKKKDFERSLKNENLNGTVEYTRHDTHAVMYLVKVDTGDGIETFYGDHIIGDPGADESLKSRWDKFLNQLTNP